MAEVKADISIDLSHAASILQKVLQPVSMCSLHDGHTHAPPCAQPVSLAGSCSLSM